jgi:hypothetical protein
VGAARASAHLPASWTSRIGWGIGRLRLLANLLRRPVISRSSTRVLDILWVALLELLTPVLAVLLAPLFYWRVLTPNPNDAATFPVGDFTDLNYPFRRWVAEEVARGQSPLWDAFMSAGHSAIGDIQFRVLYPPDAWLAQYVGGWFPVQALELEIVGHVALGTLFTYLLARRLTGSRLGGLVSAIVFGFGGYLSGFPVQQVNLLDASVWLPLILLCVDVGATYNLVTAFVVGAGALSLAALAGHPQTLFYDGLAAGLYLLYKGWNQGRVRLAALPGIPVLFLGGVGLAASALIPAYLHLGLTDRSDVSYTFSSTGFALHEALGLVFPNQFGGAPLYSGIFSLVLVAIGLGASRRRANRLFWLGLGILCLILSFGGGTFLQSIFYLLLGPLKFRQYERSVFLIDLSVAVLAGYGAADLTSGQDLRLGWLRRAISWPLAALAGFGLLCAIESTTASGAAQSRLIGLVDRTVFAAIILGLGAAVVLAREKRTLKPAAAGLLAVLLVGIDLFSTNWQNNLRPGDPNDLLSPTPIVDYLENYTTGLYRIASEGLLPGDGNDGSLYRLEDVVGNTPLETSDYSQFTRIVPELARWQVLNVRYIVTKRKIDDPRLHLLRQDGQQNLYELDHTIRLPRAYVVYKVVTAPDHQAALELLKDVDVRNTAIVEGTVPSLQADGGAPTPVRITSYDANDLSLSAELTTTGLLVVSEVDYPGWQAQVDGHNVPIYRTDGIVRGIVLPPGHHDVEFRFVPPGLQQGRVVSALSQRLLIDVVIAEVALRLAYVAFRAVRRIRWQRRWHSDKQATAQPH